MNARLLRRTLGGLVVLAALSSACELAPSRSFTPPVTVVSGPPARVFAARVPVAQGVADPGEEQASATPSSDTAPVPAPVVVRRLRNGMLVHALQRADLPTATVLLVLGTKAIPSPLPVAMLYVSAAMGATTWARVELDGAHLFGIAQADFVAVGITSLAPVLEPLLARRLPEVVKASLWANDVDNARASVIGGIGGDPAGRRAEAIAFASLFPASHPYEWAAERAIPERYRDVRVATVHAFRDANLTADNMMVVASGNVNVDSLVVTLDRALAELPRKPMAPSSPAPPRPTCAGQVRIADDPGSLQATVHMAFPAPAARHADTASLEVLAAAAGGTIATHLNSTLRKERGLSYTLLAEHQAMREGGILAVHGDVDPERIVDALHALDDELQALQAEPLGEEELRIAKVDAAHRSAWGRGATAAIRLARASVVGVPMFGAPAIEEVTREQVRSAAARYLQRSQRCIVVVGDGARLEHDLRGAGFGDVVRVR